MEPEVEEGEPSVEDTAWEDEAPPRNTLEGVEPPDGDSPIEVEAAADSDEA